MTAASATATKLSLRVVARSAWATYQAHLPLLIGAGLVIFVPVSLLEAFDHILQSPLEELDEEVGAGPVAAAIAGAAAHAVGALLGEILFAGAVAGAVVAAHEGRDSSLIAIARILPYGRLIAADLLLALLIVVGLLALVVPGLLFLAWFAVVGPVIKLERKGVVDGFRRSYELVRGSTLRVLVVLLPIYALQAGASDALQSADATGETFLGDWLAAFAVNMIAAPVAAVVTVVLYLELRRLSDRPAERAPVAAAASVARSSPRTRLRSSHRSRP